MGATLRGAMGIGLALCGLGCAESLEPGSGPGGGGGCEIAGAETAESSVSPCTVATSALTAEAAVVIDPKVQGDLDLLGRAFDIGFHHGDFACGGSGPTSDGRLLMQPHVREILYRQQAPAFEQVTAAQCPNYFSYSIDITVTTDNGVLSGTLTGEATHYENSEGGRIRQDVYVFAQAPAQDLSGRLGVRVNPARPWVARVGGQFKLGDDGTSQGQLFSSTDYTDVMLPSDCAIYDEGDGIYWPVPSPHNECGWLGAPRSSGSRMLTLDELRAL